MKKLFTLLFCVIITLTIGLCIENKVSADGNVLIKTEYLYSRNSTIYNSEYIIAYGSNKVFDFQNNFCREKDDGALFANDQQTKFIARVTKGSEFISISGPLTTSGGYGVNWKDNNNTISNALIVTAIKPSNGETCVVTIYRIDGEGQEKYVQEINNIKIDKAKLVAGTDYVVPTKISNVNFNGSDFSFINNTPGVKKVDSKGIGEMWYRCYKNADDKGIWTNDATSIKGKERGTYTIEWVINSTDYYYGVCGNSSKNYDIQFKNPNHLDFNIENNVCGAGEVVIGPADLSTVEISGVNDSYLYTGSAIEPKPLFTFYKGTTYQYAYDSSQYVNGDLSITYANNINLGTATITISPSATTENYVGTKSKTFKIINNTINLSSQSGTVTVGTAGTVTYNISPEFATGQKLPTSYTLNWCNSSGGSEGAVTPTGVTYNVGSLTSGAGTLSVTTNSSTAAGDYYFTISCSIDSKITTSSVTKFTVDRSKTFNISVPSTTTKDYDGSALSGEINPVDGATIYYQTKATNSNTYGELTTEVPTITNASSIDVKAIAYKGENEKSNEVTYTLTINKLQLAITPCSVDDKDYDGTNTANVTIGTLSGVLLVDTGKVSISANATFADANAGSNKNVTVVYSLSGDSAKNYDAPGNEIVTAEIRKASGLSITDSNNFTYTKKYDGTAIDYTPVVMLNGSQVTNDLTFKYQTSNDGSSWTDAASKPEVKYTGTTHVKVIASKDNYEDCEATYVFTITKRVVYISSESISKPYDQTEIVVNNGTVTIATAGSTVTYDGLTYTIDGFISGDGFTSTPISNGKIDRMGFVYNAITYELNKTDKPNYYYEDNYIIIVDEGTLTITEPINQKYHINLESLKNIALSEGLDGLYFELSDDENLINDNDIKKDINIIKQHIKSSKIIPLNINLLAVIGTTPVENYQPANGHLITFSYDFDFTNTTNVRVSRVHHDSGNTTFTEFSTSPNKENYEYVEFDRVNKKIIVHARFYSTYAICYDDVVVSSSSSSSTAYKTVKTCVD